MTWAEIKKAVEEAGISEDEEIDEIHCSNGRGLKSFHTAKLGRALKLTEDTRDEREDYAGCAA
jgi:hypothetical protein